MDSTIWSILISLVVLGFALAIRRYLDNIFEGDRQFMWLVGIFLVIYTIASVAISLLKPTTNALAGTLSNPSIVHSTNTVDVNAP